MDILKEAYALSDELTAHRRFLHANAEQHFDLPVTAGYIFQKLTDLRLEPKVIGRSGIICDIGNGEKTVILRADMDALPIKEETGLPFSSATASMHACGHDFHSSMLLAAAKIIKNNEKLTRNRVRLMFQPAEETLCGANDMLENGLLCEPVPDAAIMLHVITGSPLKAGTILFHDTLSYVACDWFSINITGKGAHGAAPNNGVDPLNIISHINIALQSVTAREISPDKHFALTVGCMNGGTAHNIIPETAFLSGTIRTSDNATRVFARERLKSIAENTAIAFRAEAEVTFERGCPCLITDKTLMNNIKSSSEKLFGADKIMGLSDLTDISLIHGSEDFAYISEKVPSIAVDLIAGNISDGYKYPLHHPKTDFTESVLPVGCAFMANAAFSSI